MRRYLVVANRTVGSPILFEHLARCSRDHSCMFCVVVPLTHEPRRTWTWTWTEGEARLAAEARLRGLLDRLVALGVHGEGEIGDANPMAAVADVLKDASFDEIILSTFPPGRSRWIRQDLPRRLERRFGLPVTHVVSEASIPSERTPEVHATG